MNYLFAIPRDQLVRPGQRRSLMKRALTNIVPVEIRERQRKAFVVRGPLECIRHKTRTIHEVIDQSWMADHGLIDAQCLRSCLDVILQGSDPRWWPSLVKTVTLELWIKANTERFGHFQISHADQRQSSPQIRATKIRASHVAP